MIDPALQSRTTRSADAQASSRDDRDMGKELELGLAALPKPGELETPRTQSTAARLSESRAYTRLVANQVGWVVAGALGTEWKEMAAPEIQLRRTQRAASEEVWAGFDKRKTLVFLSPALLERLDAREIAVNYARRKEEIFKIDGRSAIVHELTHWVQAICCLHALLSGRCEPELTASLKRDYDPRLLKAVKELGINLVLAEHGEFLINAAEQRRGLADRIDQAYEQREAAKTELAVLLKQLEGRQYSQGLWGKLRSSYDSLRQGSAERRADSWAGHYESLCCKYWDNPLELEAFGMQYYRQDPQALREFFKTAENLLVPRAGATLDWFRRFSGGLMSQLESERLP